MKTSTAHRTQLLADAKALLFQLHTLKNNSPLRSRVRTLWPGFHVRLILERVNFTEAK